MCKADVPLLRRRSVRATEIREVLSNCTTSGPRQNEQLSRVRAMTASISCARCGFVLAGRGRDFVSIFLQSCRIICGIAVRKVLINAAAHYQFAVPSSLSGAAMAMRWCEHARKKPRAVRLAQIPDFEQKGQHKFAAQYAAAARSRRAVCRARA